MAEQMLGRKLEKGERVYHKNGIKDDNRPENLEILVGVYSNNFVLADLVCPHCGRKYLEE